jgi:hypothetical protein
MKFPFNCLGCGFENYAEWSHIGRQVCCAGCGRVAIVPAPMEPALVESTAKLAVRFACPGCGRQFATKPALFGQKIRCSGCGAGVRVPAGNSFPVEHASRVTLIAINSNSQAIPQVPGPVRENRPPAARSIAVPAPPFRDIGPAGGRSISVPAPPFRDVGPPAGRAIWVPDPPRVVVEAIPISNHATAPAPGAPIRSVEAIAANNPLSAQAQLEAVGALSHHERAEVMLPSRAETMDQVRQEAAKKEAAETIKVAEKAKKAKKKKRKKAGYFDTQETLTLIAGVGVVVAVLALAAWRFAEFRYPLGGLLAVLGVLFYIFGTLSLRHVVRNEGFLKLMAFRFFPPYQFWFIITHWEDTREFFAILVSGMAIAAIGVTVVRTSPAVAKAEASHREYQAVVDEFVLGKGPQGIPPPVMKKTDNSSN